uniref:DDE Tnp4 domain-containing protein n=1 Tax=Lactuca sativa TaxID=4236 RepID=A0A9R1WQZ5_LACSA|nr:hypothetical protein LSAT_V11C100019990 [Lactuca sativa]
MWKSDCICAIDGIHVKAFVPQRDQIKYIGRKNCVTQNIIATCDFNMCFTFVWVGWEGSAHDTRIFNEARRRREVKFPLSAKRLVLLLINRSFIFSNSSIGVTKRYAFKFQLRDPVKIVSASMAIHNYIRMSGSGDATLQIAQEESYIMRNDEGHDDDIEPHDEVSSGQRRNDDMYMSAVRDMIVGHIFSRSNTRARNGV